MESETGYSRLCGCRSAMAKTESKLRASAKTGHTGWHITEYGDQLMNWIDSPSSSNITRFGYDDATQVLYVEFKNGSVYQYFDIPENVFEQMKAASSKGQFLAQNIKGAYRYARL